jgi:hypothetical protein
MLIRVVLALRVDRRKNARCSVIANNRLQISKSTPNSRSIDAQEDAHRTVTLENLTLRQPYSETYRHVDTMRAGAMSASDTPRRVGNTERTRGRRYSESHRSAHPGDPDYVAARKEAMDFSIVS